MDRHIPSGFGKAANAYAPAGTDSYGVLGAKTGAKEILPEVAGCRERPGKGRGRLCRPYPGRGVGYHLLPQD